MTKDDLLKNIAETGYNVGFGAKKHFSTFDIIDKIPGIIAFFSMAVGIFALVFDALSTKSMSATFIVFGILGIYISSNQHFKIDYCQTGKTLTQLFNELKSLYFTVKADSGGSMQSHMDALKDIEERYNDTSISKQILFSAWSAHYKFFWEQQIDWIEEQKKFTLFRDKIPLSFTVFMLLSLGFTTYFFLDLSSLSTCFEQFTEIKE